MAVACAIVVSAGWTSGGTLLSCSSAGADSARPWHRILGQQRYSLGWLLNGWPIVLSAIIVTLQSLVWLSASKQVFSSYAEHSGCHVYRTEGSWQAVFPISPMHL